METPPFLGSSLGRLTRLDARTIWPHEALNFTPWLLENADLLSETLGIDVELTANEHPVGGYALDLIGIDRTNDCTLIIENQLTTTDHGHLGQLLTYAAGTDAATIVWIATLFREEHRQALTYLNDIAGENARFFAIEIGAVRIGDSKAAPVLKLIAEPNNWHAAVVQKVKDVRGGGEKRFLYRSFWESLLTQIQLEMPGWSRVRKAQAQNWMNIQWPTAGVQFNTVFARNQQMRVEVYIDTGDAEENEAIFDHLSSQKAIIERNFGNPLNWEELQGKRACRISTSTAGDILLEEEHAQYLDWMIRQLRNFRVAFPPKAFKSSL